MSNYRLTSLSATLKSAFNKVGLTDLADKLRALIPDSDSSLGFGDLVDRLLKGQEVYVPAADSEATGASQAIAHGMTGLTPKDVIVIPTEIPAGYGFSWAPGTHTSTNIVVTVEPAGVRFMAVVLSWV